MTVEEKAEKKSSGAKPLLEALTFMTFGFIGASACVFLFTWLMGWGIRLDITGFIAICFTTFLKPLWWLEWVYVLPFVIYCYRKKKEDTAALVITVAILSAIPSFIVFLTQTLIHHSD